LISFSASQRVTRFPRGFFAFLFDFLFHGIDLLLVFFLFEVFVVPEIGFIEQAVAGVARIEDDFVHQRFEIRLPQVGAGGLERIEQQARGLVLDLSGEKKTHDLHERHLDGIGVFEHEQEKCRRRAAAIGREADALFLVALVEVAKTVASQRGRAALRAVGFQVLTAIWVRRHFFSLSSARFLAMSYER
jgi:hypothetical protein